MVMGRRPMSLLRSLRLQMRLLWLNLMLWNHPIGWWWWRGSVAVRHKQVRHVAVSWPSPFETSWSGRSGNTCHCWWRRAGWSWIRTWAWIWLVCVISSLKEIHCTDVVFEKWILIPYHYLIWYQQLLVYHNWHRVYHSLYPLYHG